jgi:hypothetical protein
VCFLHTQGNVGSDAGSEYGENTPHLICSENSGKIIVL